jgi:HAD superfamily hydrolase (TIGR01490 family)
MMQFISIFDLDRTITRRGTWSPFLLFAARRLRPWRLALSPAAIAAIIAYKSGLISRKRLKEMMQRIMIGKFVTGERMAGVAEAFADRCIDAGIYPEALDLIHSEQVAGRRVLIATAAHHFYLDAIAERIGVGEVIGTQSQWRADNISPGIVGDNCYGQSKLTQIEAFLLANDIDRSQSRIRFYSDHISDLPTFNWADEAVAVNPSVKLAKHAAAVGWQIIDWRQNKRLRNKVTRMWLRSGDAATKAASIAL